MSQFSLWLYPLILSAGLAIFFLVRHGIKWTWGSIIQQLMILSAAALGFITGNYALWAGVGWFLFFLFNIGGRALANRAQQDLGLLRTGSAVRKARQARLLIWGPVGVFGLEMAQAVDAIVNDDPETANRIVEKWEKSGLPRRVKDYLHGYVMLGRVIQREYRSIANEYETLERDRQASDHKTKDKAKDRMPFEVFSAAARAYLELDMYEQALDALEEHDMASYRMHPVSLDTLWMAFAALLGAEDQLKQVESRLAQGRHALPHYSRLFWIGRCHARRGQVDEAIATFRKALPMVPENDEAWKSRIEGYIATLEEHLASQQQGASLQEVFGQPAQMATAPAPEVIEPAVPPLPTSYFQSRAPRRVPAGVDGVSHAVIDDATRDRFAPRLQYVFERANYIHGLIAPSKMGSGTKCLLAALIGVFVVVNAWQVMPDSRTFHVAELSAKGILMAPSVMAGEWWRLFTYMFLHANISHLAMNVLGLVWFGKLVERLYGTPRFLFLYFAAGLLSGLAHMASTPDQPAVGASGAIMGIFGAGTAAMLRLRGVIPANIRRTELIWLFSLAGVQIVFDQVINLFASTTDESGSKALPRVASMAHLGGMVSGFLLGLVVPLKAVDRRFSGRSLDVNRKEGL